MLELIYHNAQYMSTRNSFAYKDALKSIAPWPDVLFDGELRVWLVDWRCFDKLAETLGNELCATPDFWLACPLPAEPQPVRVRRRSKAQVMAQKRQDAQAAGRFGAAIVAAMHKEA